MKKTKTNASEYAHVNTKQVPNGKDDHVDSNASVDAVQAAIGNLGRWQIIICLAMSLVKFPVAWHQLAIVFMAPHQDYNCTEPATTEKYSKDQCTANVNGTLIKCTEWEYDRTIFPETIISQWNLVCDRTHYANIQQSILMFGILLGNIIFGSLADRYGRKTPLIVSIVLQLLSGIGCAVVPWFYALLLLKLLSALATGGTMVTSYVICMEIVGTKWRAAITVLYQVPFSLGHMSLAGFAFWFRHWQQLQIAITLPSIILLSYWWIIPESPRWLLAVGKQREACEILRKGANVNKVENIDIPEIVRKHCLHQNLKKSTLDYKASFFDLLRMPNMRVKSISIFFNWMVCGMGLFGISQYIGQVGGDIFINFAVSGAIQIPGNFVAWWAMNALGRRITLICSNSISGVACLFLIFVSNDMAWLRLLLACIGLVGMSVSFTTVYLFSGELFPTVVRNIGIGASSMCARVGSILAPFVVSLNYFETWLSPTIFGILPLIGSSLCLLLPETAGCTLPETLQDGEEFGKEGRFTSLSNMFYLLFLACLTMATGHTFNTVYSWKQVEFTLPNDTIRNEYIASGNYIPENNMPLGLAIWHKKMFVTVPRWKKGVLATLNSFSMSDNKHSPALIPYPDLEANNISSPDGLVNIFRLRIDACDRMWGLDTGVDDILGDFKVVRPMRLIVIDLKTNMIIRKYTLKDTDVKPESFIADLAVDVAPEQCDKAYAYMSDLGKYGIVVYSWEKNDSWRINHHFFHFDPLNGDFNISGYNFQWTDGVFGMSLTPIDTDGNRMLYFHSMAGITEFSVPTDILQDNQLKKSGVYSNFHIVGTKGPLTQGPSSIIDPKTCINYFAQVNRNGIACWDITKELNPKTFKLVAQDNTTLVFPQDVVIDNESRKLYVLSNNLQKFMYDSFDPLTTNFFITSADLDTLTPMCKDNAAKS